MIGSVKGIVSVLGIAILLVAVACTRETQPVVAPTNTPVLPNIVLTATVAPTTEPNSTPAPTEVPSAMPTPTVTVTVTPTLDTTPGVFSPSFQETDCSDFEGARAENFECGFLTVLEDRNGSDGATIRLAVLIARGEGDNPAPDPVVYLAGGPGENAIEASRFLYGRHFVNFTADRDLIIFDQRGTGLSEPALDCQELLDLRDEINTMGQHVSPEIGLSRSKVAFTDCHDRLAGEGVNFAAFSSEASASDIQELMVALGYEEWNLYGLSYGTRLALTSMRDYPENIRSVVLDSTYPLQVNLYTDTPANVDRAFDVLFQGCASDPECNSIYPDLENVYKEAVVRLNDNPIEISITNPLSGQTLEPLIAGMDLTAFMFQSLYATQIIPSLPKIIYDAQDGNLDTLALIMGSFLVNEHLVSPGMQLSVQCREEIAFTTKEDIVAAADSSPRLGELFKHAATLGPEVVSVCQEWGAGIADEIENEPVVSDIPTLVLAGEYDPITPPVWGKMVAEDLSNSYLYEFPGIGHGASVLNECPLSITLDFLNNPTTQPDANCIVELGGPTFEVPTVEISLQPFVNTDFGISGLVPDGWIEIAPSAFSKTALGETVIIQQAAPIGPDQLLGLLVGQLQLDEPPASSGTREAQGFTWTLYETQGRGLNIDLALMQNGGATYVIILSAPASERDLLYDEVFLAAVDALRPG